MTEVNQRLGAFLCCSSKTGSIVIAILEIIAGITWTLIMMFQLLNLDLDDQHVLAYYTQITSLLIVDIVLGVVGVVLAGVLLLGIYQAEPTLIQVWIGFQLSSLVVTVILFIVAAGNGSGVLQYAVSFLLNLWFLAVVCDYLKNELGNERRRQNYIPVS